MENTHNACGGKVLPRQFLSDVRALATEKGLRVHLDGARFFNALAEYDESPAEVAACFDSMSVCLSKGGSSGRNSVMIMDLEKEGKMEGRRDVEYGEWRMEMAEWVEMSATTIYQEDS